MRGPAALRSALFLHLLLTLTSCGGSMPLDSRWLDREVLIDGDDADWGSERYILENVPISVGIMNDAKHLYLSMVTGDRNLQTQIARRGLELWLDPGGGRKYIFGVRLPGAMHGDPPSDRMHPSDRLATKRGSASINPQRLQAMFESLAGSHIFVLDGPQEEGRETTAGVSGALQIAIHYDRGRLVYEARLPLQYDGLLSYDIPLAANTRIGVGLKVAMLPAANSAQRAGMGGGRGGGMSAGRNGTGGRGGRRRARDVNPFEIWAKVHLALTP